MWSGVSALQNIDQSLSTLRNDVVRLDTQLSQQTQSLAESQRYRLRIVQQIAKVRLQAIDDGSLQQSLTAADQQAEQILATRDQAIEQLNTQIDDLQTQINAAEQHRHKLLQDVNGVSQKVVDCEAGVQNSLQHDAAYLVQLEKARTAQSIALEARHKAEQAQSDLAEKAKPYQQDSLFMYLWQRGFGTTEYKGGLFSRAVDSWVAKLIDFAPARVNFWNLTEIPKRLHEHAERSDGLADSQHEQLQVLELAQLSAAGVNELESELATVRSKLDQQDDLLENLEDQQNDGLASRAKFIAGQDSYLERCLSGLVTALQHQDLRAVHRYVIATQSPTDDQLLIELQSLDDRNIEINGDLQGLRKHHDSKLSRLKELESVRRNFKNSRFDDVRSGFGNESLLAGVLGQFLQGAISGSDLWGTIQRNQRYRDVASVPDFGSGGLGQIGDLLGGGGVVQRPTSQRNTRQRNKRQGKKRQSSWHLPTPRRGGGGFNLPRGGGSGGGFKTGGGF